MRSPWTARALALLALAAACASPSRSERTPLPWATDASAEPADAPAEPAAPPAPPPPPPAFLWEVTAQGAPDRPLYLTGSIHLGKSKPIALPQTMERAFQRSQVLVVELDPASPRVRKDVPQVTLDLGTYQKPDHLSAHLSEETKALLPAGLARVRLPAEGAETLRPWVLAMTIAMLELERVGYDPEYGIDRLLLGWARGHKKIVELETMNTQMAALAGIPEPVQDLLLRATLRDAPRQGDDMAQLMTAWTQGDAAAVERITFKDAADPAYAPLYERLFYARNRAMAEKIAGMVNVPEVHFVAVGAGHVVGPQGLLALLEKKGFTIRQLPGAPPSPYAEQR
jgi:uncharacterized protein YbaP (TraB family)